MSLVPELVEESEVLVINVDLAEEEVVVLALALDGAVVFIMVKMSLCARTFICVSRYRARMYVFDTEEFMPTVGSSCTGQPAGFTVTVSGTACSARKFQCFMNG
jgi:hypothetical protein